MTASINLRLRALERPYSGPCASCELERLNRAAAKQTERPVICTHWPRRDAAEELRELNSIGRVKP